MTPERGRLLAITLLAVAVFAVGLAVVLDIVADRPRKRPLPGPDLAPLPLAAPASLGPGAARILAAGDIGRCGSRAAAATGDLVRAVADAHVLVLGDVAYERGTDEDFARCFDPVWGSARARTIPVPGNHDHATAGAAGYRRYFGESADGPGRTWGARDLGAWRVYQLDTECGAVGGCGEGSAQLAWLRDDLGAHPSDCILALWHRPYRSSGPHGDDPAPVPLWRELAAAGADVVLQGHDHLYERFAPLDAAGAPDPDGIRSWVVGTGGDQLYFARDPRPGSEALWDRAWGVLEVALRPDGYDWRFLAAMGDAFDDAGSGSC